MDQYGHMIFGTVLMVSGHPVVTCSFRAENSGSFCVAACILATFSLVMVTMWIALSSSIWQPLLAAYRER